MVLKNFYDGLPNELIEAATIDRAEALCDICVHHGAHQPAGPCDRAGADILSCWNELQMALIFINKSALQPLSVVPRRFQQQRSGGLPVEVMYACLVVCLAPIAVFFVFAQRFLVAGLTAGAVRGVHVRHIRRTLSGS